MEEVSTEAGGREMKYSFYWVGFHCMWLVFMKVMTLQRNCGL